ncbi:MAG: carbonate dehydratase [Betaproteobacteria bacterium]|nr:carbonate dehydratase [Betaproteobacteria bacterium]
MKSFKCFEMKSLKYLLALALSASFPIHALAEGKGKSAHWTYEGAHGPERWAALAPENAKCSQGKTQSPVNIIDRDVIVSDLESVQFHYQPSPFRFEHNGHTLQVSPTGENYVVIRGTRYDLLQFHFHAPSEERINFRNFSMVAHFVHKSAEGRLAVIGVLLDAGGSNPAMDYLWAHLPLSKGETVQPKSASLDMNQLLPKERGYFQFMGSLTTPPCSEGVLWTLFQEPVKIRPEQASIFLKVVGMNARPVQPLNQRLVRFSR